MAPTWDTYHVTFNRRRLATPSAAVGPQLDIVIEQALSGGVSFARCEHTHTRLLTNDGRPINSCACDGCCGLGGHSAFPVVKVYFVLACSCREACTCDYDRCATILSSVPWSNRSDLRRGGRIVGDNGEVGVSVSRNFQDGRARLGGGAGVDRTDTPDLRFTDAAGSSCATFESIVRLSRLDGKLVIVPPRMDVVVECVKVCPCGAIITSLENELAGELLTVSLGVEIIQVDSDLVKHIHVVCGCRDTEMTSSGSICERISNVTIVQLGQFCGDC